MFFLLVNPHPVMADASHHANSILSADSPPDVVDVGFPVRMDNTPIPCTRTWPFLPHHHALLLLLSPPFPEKTSATFTPAIFPVKPPPLLLVLDVGDVTVDSLP